MLRVLAILLIAVGLASCGAEKTDYTVVEPPTLNPGDALPPPAETPILTISGAISSGSVQFDRPTLRAIGVISYTVNDPFAGRPVTYQGVLLSRLLEVVGASRSAHTLHMVALNDYETDIQMADVARWPIMLAYIADGKPMTVVEKGPLMVVFPIHAYDIDPVAYTPQWVWQLARIEVRG